jgi:hypothetical protein
MVYALLMLLSLVTLGALWRATWAAMPLFLIVLVMTAIAFAADITSTLAISL